MKFATTFHRYLEKTLVGMFALCFAVVCVYIPQIHKVEAAGAGDMSTLSGQLTQLIEDAATAISTTISSIADPITAAMTGYDWTKSNLLDGLAWTLAKSVVSRMTASIVDWVNSGFQGSPAFVQDLGGFLEEVADQEFGRIMQDLGGPFSFVCAPFKLDVRVALSIEYQAARANKPVGATSCTLSGALQNIEDFISSTENFTDSGGWAAWFKITSNPVQYTPQGNLIGARASMNARLVNAKGQSTEDYRTGEGFLSSKVCEKVQTASGEREDCKISTPGKVISEALTFQLSTGPRTLIEADEINEIISAVFGQLAQQAITGAAGLLGLSAGTGYTTPVSGGSITGQIASGGLASNPQRLRSEISNSLQVHQTLLSEMDTYAVRLQFFESDPSTSGTNRALASNALTEISSIRPRVNTNIDALTVLLIRFDSITDPQSSAGSAEFASINQDYLALSMFTKTNLDGYVAMWQAILRQTNP